jgi:unsaturated rhamnogalacturonyl hydrolase
VYAIAKAVHHGYLGPTWLPVAVRGFDGLVEHMVTVDEEGQVNLHGVCASAGLGGNPYRDGSFEYYTSEPIATNDLHGVGAFILAAIQMEIAVAANAES